MGRHAMRRARLVGVSLAAGALLLTTVVGVTVGAKLFRWEKEEKIRGTAKLWVLAVLLPFVVMGVWTWLQR